MEGFFIVFDDMDAPSVCPFVCSSVRCVSKYWDIFDFQSIYGLVLLKQARRGILHVSGPLPTTTQPKLYKSLLYNF